MFSRIMTFKTRDPILQALCKLTAPVNAWKLGPLRFSRLRIELLSPAYKALHLNESTLTQKEPRPVEQGAARCHLDGPKQPPISRNSMVSNAGNRTSVVNTYAGRRSDTTALYSIRDKWRTMTYSANSQLRCLADQSVRPT